MLLLSSVPDARTPLASTGMMVHETAPHHQDEMLNFVFSSKALAAG
jgi:hypothetical protein